MSRRTIETFQELQQGGPGRYKIRDDGSTVIKAADGTMDLDFRHVKRAGAAELRMIASGPPHIVFIYNPACGWCRRRYAGFDAAGRGMPNVYVFNAGRHGWNSAANAPDMALFKSTVGLDISHYPTILGVSKQGRLLEYTGNVSKQMLKDLMKVLEAT
jgi:hypothetical protein